MTSTFPAGATRRVTFSVLILLSVLVPAGGAVAAPGCPADEAWFHDWSHTWSACVGRSGDALVVYVEECDSRNTRTGECVGRHSETRVSLPRMEAGPATAA